MTEANDVWPDPVDGAPLTLRATAELELAEAACIVADCARYLIPTRPTQPGYSRGLPEKARHLATAAARVLAAAIIAERLGGNTWGEISHSLGEHISETRSRWKPAVDEWVTATVDAALAPPNPNDRSIEERIAELDNWTTYHREDDDDPTGDHPVSDALDRMSPHHELIHLADQRRRLAATHGGTVPPAGLLPLVEREAVLEQHLAQIADPRERDDHAAAAARARTMAAHLRARSDD
jgi:hypothetical protein